MPIEVQELNIRSTVSDEDGEADGAGEQQDLERLRETILAECRAMVLDLMRAERER
ncbi:MAG TPA: DUF5908 family protein [Bryobacteraceae bacterium]|jgi:hypothetical protein|nr:DUF5908 family protein [Bryobacteraceae bacterium]